MPASAARPEGSGPPKSGIGQAGGECHRRAARRAHGPACLQPVQHRRLAICSAAGVGMGRCLDRAVIAADALEAPGREIDQQRVFAITRAHATQASSRQASRCRPAEPRRSSPRRLRHPDRVSRRSLREYSSPGGARPWSPRGHGPALPDGRHAHSRIAARLAGAAARSAHRLTPASMVARNVLLMGCLLVWKLLGIACQGAGRLTEFRHASSPPALRGDHAGAIPRQHRDPAR